MRPKNFNLKLKFEGRTIAKAEGNNLNDFDNLLNGLKEKFGEPTLKRGAKRG